MVFFTSVLLGLFLPGLQTACVHFSAGRTTYRRRNAPTYFFKTEPVSPNRFASSFGSSMLFVLSRRHVVTHAFNLILSVANLRYGLLSAPLEKTIKGYTPHCKMNPKPYLYYHK